MPHAERSEITPEHLFHSRRKFIKGMGAMAAGAFILNGCVNTDSTPSSSPVISETIAETTAGTDELGQALTPAESINSYNNFYEFTTSKEGVKSIAQDFQPTNEWKVEAGGLVKNPKTYDMAELLSKFLQEERILN